MPTFNQLVRKGSRAGDLQVHLSRHAAWSEHPEEQGHRPAFSSEERRVHRRAYFHP